jgi:hypothetical protein
LEALGPCLSAFFKELSYYHLHIIPPCRSAFSLPGQESRRRRQKGLRETEFNPILAFRKSADEKVTMVL